VRLRAFLGRVFTAELDYEWVHLSRWKGNYFRGKTGTMVRMNIYLSWREPEEAILLSKEVQSLRKMQFYSSTGLPWSLR
jgi:hypothetical protein